MDNANSLGPATLGTLNGTGFMNRNPSFMNRNPSGASSYVQGEGVFIVAEVTHEEVEALLGEKLDYFGPTEDGDAGVPQCHIVSAEDFPTLTFSKS